MSLTVVSVGTTVNGWQIGAAAGSRDFYKGNWALRAAATGRLLAESDFFEPLTINSLTTPGFGGRVHFPSAVGKGFYVLQVMPKTSPPPSK